MKLFGSKKSYAMEIATKRLIMGSEIAGLAPLRGYVKPEDRVVPVHSRLAKRRERQPAFVRRKTALPARRGPEAAATAAPIAAPLAIHSASSPLKVQSRKRREVALPLASAPAVKKEGFTWGSSNEIEEVNRTAFSRNWKYRCSICLLDGGVKMYFMC